VKDVCYTLGNHGPIWANFCSPSKTTKLVQISTGLPERASKNYRQRHIFFGNLKNRSMTEEINPEHTHSLTLTMDVSNL